MLALYKCRKWKEEVKTSNCWNFEDLILKNVALLNLNRKLNRESIAIEPRLKFRGIFIFQSLTSITVFDIKHLYFQYIPTLTCCLLFWQFRYGVLTTGFHKGIKQRRACFCPVLETCYDAAQQRWEKTSGLCFTTVLPRHSMFLKLDRNTNVSF